MASFQNDPEMLPGPGGPLLHLYKKLLFIRKVEEKIAAVYGQEGMRCPVHLGIGQEGPAVVLAANLRVEDVVYASHRSHAPYLARGGDLVAFFAELMGRTGGCSGGQGGSMHLVDPSVGFRGSTSIVAGTIPVAAGSALQFKRSGRPRLSVVHFGEAAVEEGVFFETLLFSVRHQLPLVLCMEDNDYSCYTRTDERRAPIDWAGFCRSIGLDFHELPGERPLQTVAETGSIIERVRNGLGPVLLRFKVFRRFEHCGHEIDDRVGYRTSEEISQWAAMDPIKNSEALLMSSGLMDASALAKIHSEIDVGIEQGFAAAARMPEQTQWMASWVR